MLRISTVLFLVVALTGDASISAEKPAENSAAQKYADLIAEFEDQGGARQFVSRFFELAAAHKSDPKAIDALLWISKNARGPEATKALEWLAKDHIQSEQLGPACKQIAREPSIAAEQLLRILLDKSPHPAVKAQACLALAAFLERQTTVVKQLKEQPQLSSRILQYYGQDYGRHLASLNEDKLTVQLEQVYERMRASFGAVETSDGTMGKFAEQALYRLRWLTPGRLAPEIEGQDIGGRPLKLSDYRGKVVVLSFWGHW